MFEQFLSSETLRQASESVSQLLVAADSRKAADPLRLYNIHQCGEDWMLELARQATLLPMLAAHCGHDVEFYLSHVIAKAPHSEYSVPWHQVITAVVGSAE